MRWYNVQTNNNSEAMNRRRVQSTLDQPDSNPGVDPTSVEFIVGIIDVVNRRAV